MSLLLGSLDIKDSERPFTSLQGRQIVWDATMATFEQWNLDAQDATTMFVQGLTDSFKTRYELAGGGELEQQAFDTVRTPEVKRGGSWDVAYPIYNFAGALSWSSIGLAYLTMGQYKATVGTIVNQSNNTLFRLVLKALFKNTDTSYTDVVNGTLTVVPLANGDAVVYPPKIGVTAEATENYYSAPGYSESGISNANNPFVTIRDLIEPRYGYPQGGSPIAVLCNTTAIQYAEALAAYDSVPYYNVSPGDNVSVAQALPNGSNVPGGGRIRGVTNGVFVIEWPRMPTGWMIGFHLAAPPPLMQRQDPADTGLTPGLQADPDTIAFPFTKSQWRNRLGFGVGNRLGAVVVALNGTGTYTIPTGYS